jgi:Zn-dependent protease
LTTIYLLNGTALISEHEMETTMPFLRLEWFFPVFQGLLLGVLAMVLHEAGHSIAALAVGIKVKSVGLRWKGMYTVREAGPPMKNMMVSLAGPLTNTLLLLCWHWSPRFGLANICFAAVNLLPIEGSDGDRALSCWLDIQTKSSPNE